MTYKEVFDAGQPSSVAPEAYLDICHRICSHKYDGVTGAEILAEGNFDYNHRAVVYRSTRHLKQHALVGEEVIGVARRLYPTDELMGHLGHVNERILGGIVEATHQDPAGLRMRALQSYATYYGLGLQVIGQSAVRPEVIGEQLTPPKYGVTVTYESLRVAMTIEGIPVLNALPSVDNG